MATAAIDAAYRAAEAELRAADRVRHLATLYAPPAARRHLQALFAFDAEIAGIRRKVSAPMPGEIRLQWWREVFSLERAGEAEANPIAAAILDTMATHDLPAEAFQTYLEARADALYDDPLADRPAVEARADGAEATLLRLAARILGLADADPAARHAGIAIAMATGLRDLALDIRKGRVALPLDLLEQHGVLIEKLVAGEPSPASYRPRATSRHSRPSTPDAPVTPSLPCRLPRARRFSALADVGPVVAATAKAGYAPFDRPIEIAPWRRLWALWREGRR